MFAYLSFQIHAILPISDTEPSDPLSDLKYIDGL